MSIAKSGEHHHHHHAHHYDSAEHEYQSTKQGVWLFLATEILMFGGLFVAYAIFHHYYPELFSAGSKHLDWKLGATNTVVLLFSSLTMALGINYTQTKQYDKAKLMLWITIACGFAFMLIKGVEYNHKFHEHLFPGKFFAGETHGVENMAMYFSFYFMMTGLHAIHVMIGMGLIGWVLYRLYKNEFSPEYYTPVEGVG